MPNRFSISGSYFGQLSWNDPNAWYGGIVPTSSDDVWIRGVRTTVSRISPFWPGTASEFFVANNTGFPSEGAQVYTYTNSNIEVRLNYQGLSGSNRLLGVSIDQEYSAPWGQSSLYPTTPTIDISDPKSGIIPAGAFIQFRPGVIALSGSNSGSAKILTIENGGEFALSGTSSYFIRNLINVSDGTLRAQDSSSFVFANRFTGSRYISSNTRTNLISYITNDDNPFSRTIIEGAEVRTNTILSNSASVGDTYLSVQDASNFEFGDWIFVGEDQIGYERQDDSSGITGLFTTVYSQYRSSEDETFYVIGKDTGSIPNKLYIQKMNGLEGKILATASSTEIIVDEERFKVGDKVLINNQERIITEVTSSYDYLLRDYDFTSPFASASLLDWELDPTRSPAFMNWNLAPGKGLTLQANEAINQYRHTVIKNIFRDNVKVEAWVKNDSFNLSGSLTSPAFRDNINLYGIMLHAEPANDFDERLIAIPGNIQYKTVALINPFQSSFVVINKGDYLFSDKYKPFVAGVTNIEEERKITLERSRGFIKAYIDDVCYYESIDKNGTTSGRVGIVTQNFKAVYTRFKVYAKCQKIVLNSPITGLTSNDTIYESGVELPHDINNQVIKLSSVILDLGAHKNLAFAYRGAEDNENNGIWPYIYSINTRPTQEFVQTGTGNRSLFGAPLIDGNLNGFNVGGGTGGTLTGSSIILDLTTPVSFSNFGFVEQFTAMMQNFTSSISGGLSISGSNDLYTWFPLTGGIDRRARVDPQRIRDWDLGGTHVYRYIRLQNNRATKTGLGSTNINYLNISVRSGSVNQIILNNTSDFNIGDHIFILPKSTIGLMVADPTTGDLNFNILVSGSNLPLLDGTYASYFTVTDKSGSILTLDRNVNYIIQKGTQVFKINRNINFSGSLTPNNIFTGRILGNNISNFQSKKIFKNVAFQYLTDNYYNFGSSAGRGFGAMNFGYSSPWEPGILKGCSIYNCYSTLFGWDTSTGTSKINLQIRHNIFVDTINWGVPRSYRNSSQLPYIMTGNVFNGMLDRIIQMGSYVNDSYNIFYFGGGFTGFGVFFQTNFRTNFGMNFNHNRNLYRGGLQPMVFGIPYTFNPDMTLRFTMKNNKLEFSTQGRTSTGIVNYSGYATFPIERMLLPNRLSYDANRWSNNNNYGLFNVGGGGLNIGSYTSPIKDHNGYGYDVLTNNQGWVVKEPNNEWYKFYHFSGSSQMTNLNTFPSNAYYWKNAFITAQIAIEDNTTASFTVGFDYYNDMTQQIQTEGGFAYDYSNLPNISYNVFTFTGSAPEYVYRNSIFIPVSSSYIGGLCTYLYKNGKLVSPLNRIQKTLNPQRYEVTYQLEGQGVYAICLAQDITAAGYVALKNITSRLIAPQTSSVFVLNNYFDMRFLDGALTTQFRNANNQYPQTNPKFRLKGAKLF